MKQVEQKTITVKRQSKRRPQFWLKAIGTLGLWLLWWRQDYLALSNRAVVRRQGVFVKKERAVPLNQVQDISITYGLIRRLLGHGDIRIETAGSAGTEIVMHNIDDPEDFRAQIFRKIDEFYDDGTPDAEKGKGKSKGS